MSPSKLPPVVGEERPAATTPAARCTDGGARNNRAPALSKPPRQYLTKNERARMAAKQDHKCGCGCGDPLSKEKRGTVGEHYCPVAFGNGEKPDHIRNRKCAKRKTYGGQDGAQWTPVGGDIRDIAHIRRIAEGRTQADKRAKNGPKLRSGGKLQSGRKIESAGFRKDVRRTMGGRVERVL